MMPLNTLLRMVLLLLALAGGVGASAHAEQPCEKVAGQVSRQLDGRIEATDLSEVLTHLARHRQLPPRYVTKQFARQQGWRPGADLWSIPSLHGKRMGGDRFGNRERQLPDGQWREADLGYYGGRRSAQRLVFSSDGMRFVTADHYRTFIQVPQCR